MRLEVLVKPSDWTKQAQGSTIRAKSDVRSALRAEFWPQLLHDLLEAVRDATAAPVTGDGSSRRAVARAHHPAGATDVGFGVGGVDNKMWSALFVTAEQAPVLDAALEGIQQACPTITVDVETTDERAFITAYYRGRLTTRPVGRSTATGTPAANSSSGRRPRLWPPGTTYYQGHNR